MGVYSYKETARESQSLIPNGADGGRYRDRLAQEALVESLLMCYTGSCVSLGANVFPLPESDTVAILKGISLSIKII